MQDNEFLQGVKLETKEGQYGEYIRGSINVETIFNNPINNNKWINFVMFKSKGGKWYAKVVKPKEQTENVVNFEDEIPF